MPTVKATDTVSGRSVPTTFALVVVSNTITVSELIKARLLQRTAELKENSVEKMALGFRRDAREVVLNPTRRKAKRLEDIDTMYDESVECFQNNKLFVFVDGKQATELQETFAINADTEVRFLHLKPLVGG